MSTVLPKNLQKTSDGVQKISSFRRILPQALASLARNGISLNVGEFVGFPSIVIPSLIGLSKKLNPDETLHVTAAQTSWLASFAYVAHPIGSLLSGPLNDRIGRRKAIMLFCIPLTVAWIMLGFAQSFPLICFGFALIGFSLGLKDAPASTYISEITEPSVRSVMMTISIVSFNCGIFIILSLGYMFSWRQVSLICALVPFSTMIAVFFIPESPVWLISKDRYKDAQKSLQWLRGWVSPQTIHEEFTELQKYSITSNSCVSCGKQSLKCYHPKPTFFDKIQELKRKRNLKPFILLFCLQFFNEFSGFTVWQPYIIQVLNALGTPINPNMTTVITSSFGMAASIVLILTVKRLGRRKTYLTSCAVVATCCFGLSIYGFIMLPKSGWISFKTSVDDTSKDLEHIRNIVGNYSYIPLVLIFIMQFAGRIGVAGAPHLFLGEVFPFKSRSFLCGISLANHYLLTAIATKTYYNVEILLSLPGAILFYGWITVTGFIVMYMIMPETEGRSLEDIELHYSDNTKSITDIYIDKQSKSTE